MITEEKSANKTIRLVEYLSALAKINSKIIRNLDEYRNILWIHDIPNEPKHCFALAWGLTDDHDLDIWVEVKKIHEPELPQVPTICQNWIKPETLRDTKEIPELHNTIPFESVDKDSETGEEVTVVKNLSLEDHPNVQEEWDAYLDKQWFPWTKLYDRYEAVQKVYADLFHIYQEQQKLGEQYELVFCIGLLNWKTPSGHDTRRHIIVTKASLEFEPHLGKFTVKSAVDGDQVNIELDMLDIQDHPQNTRQLVESGEKTVGANLWDKPNIDTVLASIVNSLADSGQGDYYSDRLKPTNNLSNTKPVIDYAPALILRKRSMRGLEHLLTTMKEQIESGGDVPSGFLDLSESLPESVTDSSDESLSKKSVNDVTETYFPKPSNAEQRRIIHTFNQQKGVLVQGPPGTGKSHTIANLICHLLATGKRVLVTAKTPRALQVLHKQLPAEIKPLCINLLGQGTEERESLEQSVAGILARLDNRPESGSNQMQILEDRILRNRKEKAEADNKILAFREAETFKHTIAGGKYKGTAAHIARELKKEENSYSWFTDTINSEDSLPLSSEEISSLRRLVVELDHDTERELSRRLPDLSNDLLDGEHVRVAFQNESAILKEVENSKVLIDSNEGKALLHAGEEKTKHLMHVLSDLAANCTSVRQRPMPWIEKAVFDVLTDRDMPWKELFKLSTQQVNRLHNLASKVDSYNISIPENLDRKKLLSDSQVLHTHFKAGGRHGVWIFKPKAVREYGSFIDKVKVDGEYCNKVDTLKKLIDYLTVEQCLTYIWVLWSGKADRHNGPFPLQVAEIYELHEALESILQLYEKREKAKGSILQINGLSVPRWEDTDSLNTLVNTCRGVLAQIRYLNVSEELQGLQNNISVLATYNNSHQINNKLSNAFENRNIDLYCSLLEDARQLNMRAKDVIYKQTLIGKLVEVVPNLAGNIACCSSPDLCSRQIAQLDKAWAWAQGSKWLTDFLSTDLDSLERHAKRLEEESRKDLAELAGVKAWQFCFTRMQEDHKRHLMSWQQAMKKLGKGTGKHAYTHRKNAQRHLNECRDAVPAWIMPLHRVYETVDAGAGIFDVIIVDEASQCGPEALPLLYLGNRILVVGDDKQISPEAVGVNRAQVQQLMRDYLYDFDHADSFDIESSLFDHGRIRFNNTITLREHFRCMPEIIRFSNDLCYRVDPLIPLRQYPPDRLDPLKAIYVQNGYRQGQGQRVTNIPEAELLVETIVTCCQDERYTGMTMGVIVLQGEAQAYTIESLLLQKLGAEEMESRRLICGNPYSFQGDERDIIFLSMVAAPNERIGVMNKPADQRRFNVAASRAKDQMWLFYSSTSNHLSEHCFRRRLLDHFLNPTSHIARALGEAAEDLRDKAHRANRTIEKAPAPFDSWFEVDVALHIASQGYRVVPQYEFADKRIDLVVQGSKTQLAVECDGDFWHGADEYNADMERQRKLERCGWQFFRIRECRYYSTPEKSLEILWDLLDRMGIMPLNTNSEQAPEGDKDAYDNDIDEKESELFHDDQDEADSNSTIGKDTIIEGDMPLDIQEALKIKNELICKAIIHVLKHRPKNSCVKENLTTYILKHWNIRTSGLPRDQFAKRVNRQIAVMERKGYIILYKSKNIRVKLGWVSYPE